ncbi:hypothetical protein Tco_0593967 [Tanacetum coccineum]
MEILLEPTSNKLMADPHGFKGIYKEGHGDTYLMRSSRLMFEKLDAELEHLEMMTQAYVDLCLDDDSGTSHALSMVSGSII